MNLDSVKSNLEKFLNEKKLKLFEITYQKSEETLSIILDERIDMKQIEEISNELSEYLDKFEEEFDNNYILDVSTVGAERPIRSETELKAAIGSYIYVSTKQEEYYGTLLNYQDGLIELQTKDKTRTKNVSIEYKNISQVRYAVKF